MLFLKVFKKPHYMCFLQVKEFLCTLFRLFFIALQNVGVISVTPCIMAQSNIIFIEELQLKEN